MRLRDIKRHQLITIIVVFVLIAAIISFFSNSRVGAILEGLRAPILPRVVKAEKQVWLDQNWGESLTQKFHHITQGTHTLPIPLTWFMALEQPKRGLLSVPFGREDKFSDNDYLLRFGFIEGQVNEENPHGLPVGFATTPLQTLPGVHNKQTAIGFTCAACHTGHIRYNKVDYVIEGGPASTDLGLLTQALAAAVGQTYASSKIPLLDGRFKRFAKNVLQEGYNDTSMLALKTDLETLATYLGSQPMEVEVIEGFSRLDALNRIGNEVFALDPVRYDNYVAINAPVAYPHIWTASWFNWVQYDGSIMQPLVRNAGEALGVRAYLDTTAKEGQKRYSSSVPINNLSWIEEALAGAEPYPAKQFSGLLSPKWPDTFPPIDKGKASQGRELYQQHCQGCHLPPLNSEAIWKGDHFAPITYYIDGLEKQTPESVLTLKIISLEQVGTDPAQANVLTNRTVNTAGDVNASSGVYANAMGVNAQVCTPEPLLPQSPYNETMYRSEARRLVNIPVSDGPNISFALALGAVVQQTNDEWFDQRYITAKQRDYYEGERPNCLQAGAGYKARPLNGIWATAPFLHNGSVVSLMDLLKPGEERPTTIQLGNIEFDAVNVGIQQEPKLRTRSGTRYAASGIFILDTSVPGNSNRGHEFSRLWDASKGYDEQVKGVIGPELSQDERRALIEFLKTL